LYVNDAYLTHFNRPERARLRGLARNPAVPGDMLLKLLERPLETQHAVMYRGEWSDEAFDALAGHPDPKVRMVAAKAPFATPEKRARLIDDPVRGVRASLAAGAGMRQWPGWTALPLWAYERLVVDESPGVRWALTDTSATPREILMRLTCDADPDIARSARGALGQDDEDTRMSRAEAEALAGDDNEWSRRVAAGAPVLPAHLVAALAADPSPLVRLAVSMRPELTEEERAAVDYHVGRDDRVDTPRWVEAADLETLERCVRSAHLGLRRASACNPNLTADLIALLAADEDFAVRLLLCENHADVPDEVVLATYLEAEVVSRVDLLRHPAFPRVGLARLAASPDPRARQLVALDPQASATLIERLSHDDDSTVRYWMASDARLAPARIIEFFDDPQTTEAAAANPHLPVDLMHRILDDGLALT
jgi:cytochrome c5